jgi:hypothetical protein
MDFFNHPDYDAKRDKWQTYRDLYEGDHATLTQFKYLWPHELELSTEQVIRDPSTGESESSGVRIRRIRAYRSRYLNLTEPVVSNLIAMAFSKPMEVDPATTAMLGDDIKNIDGKGTSLESFIKGKIAEAYFRDGSPIVHVDAPGNDARSAGEERAIGFRPFMETLDVLSVKDWQFGETGAEIGKYTLLRQEYEAIEPRASMTEKPTMATYCKVFSLLEGGGVRVEIFRRDEKDKEWKSFDARDLSLPELPVVTITTNDSWIKDVSELQLVLFNLMSAWYNQLNTQAFQRIFVSGLDKDGAISISEYAISRIPLEAKPYVIEPSSTAAYVEAAAITTDQIAKVAFNRTRSLAAGSKEAPGAETIAEMNTELIALLKQALEEIEGLVNSALKLYAIYKLGPERGAAFDGKVTFSKDLDTKAVSQRIEMFLTYRDEIRKVLSWRKAELKRVASEMGYGDEELKDIRDGIDALQDEPVINPLLGVAPFTDQEIEDGDEEGEADNEEAGSGSGEDGSAAGSAGQ